MLELFPKFYSCGTVFEPVKQIKYKQGNIMHTATLFFDNLYYIELENEDSIIKRRIDGNITDVTLFAENINGSSFAAVYGKCRDKKYNLFIGYDEDYKILGEYYLNSSKIEKNKLILNKTYNDMCRHSEEIYIDYDGKNFKETEKKKSVLKPIRQNNKLLPYYFTEAVLSKNYGEAIIMLDKNSYKDITDIQLENFFGDFSDILQNIYDEKYAGYIAIKKHIAKSFYELKYYDFKIKEGLIDNILGVE